MKGRRDRQLDGSQLYATRSRDHASRIGAPIPKGATCGRRQQGVRHRAGLRRASHLLNACTSLHLKTRTQDSLYMSWPNILPQGGSEVLLFYVND
jgi:hypothetical protein